MGGLEHATNKEYIASQERSVLQNEVITANLEELEGTGNVLQVLRIINNDPDLNNQYTTATSFLNQVTLVPREYTQRLQSTEEAFEHLATKIAQSGGAQKEGLTNAEEIHTLLWKLPEVQQYLTTFLMMPIMDYLMSYQELRTTSSTLNRDARLNLEKNFENANPVTGEGVYTEGDSGVGKFLGKTIRTVGRGVGGGVGMIAGKNKPSRKEKTLEESIDALLFFAKKAGYSEVNTVADLITDEAYQKSIKELLILYVNDAYWMKSKGNNAESIVKERKKFVKKITKELGIQGYTTAQGVSQKPQRDQIEQVVINLGLGQHYNLDNLEKKK